MYTTRKGIKFIGNYTAKCLAIIVPIEIVIHFSLDFLINAEFKSIMEPCIDGCLLALTIAWPLYKFVLGPLCIDKETTEKLRVLNERNKAILASAKFSIITVNIDGVITSFNNEAERILGYRAEEMIGVHTPEKFHDKAEVLAAAKRYGTIPGMATLIFKADKGEKDSRQWTYIRKDGTTVQVNLDITSLHSKDGIINGYMGVAEDLTEELRVNELINQQNAKLQSAAKMASLGEMAAGIAHEINNPLSIVVGKANLLLQNLEKASLTNEKLKESLEKIISNSNRASKIITGLKALSRNVEGEPMALVDMDAILNDSLDMCRERLKSNGIKLLVESSTDALFNGRSIQIGQVLTNLLNNASDAVCNNENSWIKVKVTETDDRVRVTVTDSGAGIPTEIRGKLMQPFFTTKGVGKGTGLGLSVSRQIAVDHGGSLSIDETCPNTCFILELPKPEVIKRAA